MALTLSELVGYQEAAEEETKTLEDVVLEIATKQLEEKGKIDDSIYDTIIGRVDEELYEVDRSTGYISRRVSETAEDDDKSWQLWIEELENVIGGLSIPSMGELLGALGGVSSAVLAPVLIAFEAVSATIATIKEFISNLASDIATGMETALATIGTIVIDPLLGILSAFGDYLGEKISGFIENAIGEK